jgi:enoyl-[acyl-carrier-protein] reductase (NADH)
MSIPASCQAEQLGFHSPRKRSMNSVALLSEPSGGVTGEIHFVDSGYNVISMPRPDELKDTDQ